MVVHELEFEENINNLQKSDMIFNTDWQFGMFKRGQDNGHDTWKV